ncbi:hypothetical protein WQ57_08615 [Mesobacillus campisalis]|uniref:Lipoprotein n=1 Tax=Mesobacillus campisalis TaxID=1408103 RepID=A0A0M2T080_9BACI|nr:hypothetical protein [Mesobacillus campisalis]KKK38642.1 hypothetical protein WQ57_08615 [Mesobacillus campisalis]
MKKWMAALFLVFSMFSVTGCAGNNEPPAEDEQIEEVETENGQVEDVEEEDEIGDGEVDDE